MSKARDSIEDLKTIDANLAAKAPLASPSFTGNVGIGVIPKATHTDADVLQIGGTAFIANWEDAETYVGENVYLSTAGAYKYLTTSHASLHNQTGGTHKFQVAPSGTADAAISWTTAMTIDNAGIVTKPLQPAFRAYHNIGSQSVAGGNTKIPITTVTLNAGNHYNASTSTFTAPVTGNYYLNWYSIYNGAVSNEWAKFVFSAGSNQGTQVHFSKNNANWDNVRLSGVYPMTAGSTVYVANGGNTVVYHGGVWSGFSGHLIG